MNPNNTIIRILDKEYQVSCPPEERAALVESARMLDERMRNIKNSGNVLGLERIAVMAALNLTYDLMKMKTEGTGNPEVTQQLQQIDQSLDQALQSFESNTLF